MSTSYIYAMHRVNKFHGPDKVVFDITDHPWLGAAPLDAEKAVEKTPA